MGDKVIPELQTLLEAVEARYRRPVETSKDFYTLSALIEHECREVLSAATLKRLWGYVSLHTVPRKSTLDILSRYIGFKDFGDFRTSLFGKADDTSGFLDLTYLASKDIPDGAVIRIGWEPNRLLRLRKTGATVFEVLESHNAKLRTGDRFETSCFFKGLPLILPVIIRRDETLPAFIVGKNRGLNLLAVEG